MILMAMMMLTKWDEQDELKEEELEDEATKVKEEEVEEDKKTEEIVEIKEEQGEDKREENEVKLKEFEEEGREEILLNEPPKIDKTRRRRNILVGWLCSKIVKAFVKKNVLL